MLSFDTAKTRTNLTRQLRETEISPIAARWLPSNHETAPHRSGSFASLGRTLMTGKFFASTILAFLFISPAFADPILSVIPQGVQGGNWVWEVDITPDLVQAGG